MGSHKIICFYDERLDTMTSRLCPRAQKWLQGCVFTELDRQVGTFRKCSLCLWHSPNYIMMIFTFGDLARLICNLNVKQQGNEQPFNTKCRLFVAQNSTKWRTVAKLVPDIASAMANTALICAHYTTKSHNLVKIILLREKRQEDGHPQLVSKFVKNEFGLISLWHFR